MYITAVNVTGNYEELINEWFIKQIKEIADLLCGTCHFRNLQQSPKGNLNSGLVRYQRHHSLITFLTVGSVIFYENDGQLKKLQELLNNKNLQNIGYNQYDIK